MAHIMAKRGSLDNVVTYEHYCDSIIDLENIPKEETTLGSVAIVVNDEDESIEVYIANSAKKWIPFSSVKSGSSDGENVSIEPITINENGVYTAEERTAYSPITVNVPIESSSTNPIAPAKSVNFIDYDGTIRYSYTPAEFAELSSLPANPSHSGLTAQGWNWTLAQIKSQLAAMPDTPVCVGQMYITDDNKTRIYCHFETGRLAPYLGLGVNGTVTVDWGDGSSTDTLTGTSLTTAATVQHTYSTSGDYTITLTVESGSFAFFGATSAAHILKKSTATTANINRVYANAVQRVEMGANANIGSYAFHYCYSLTSITIPDSVTSIGANAFQSCSSLTSITIPDDVTSIDSYAFNTCYSLASITIANSVTNIGANAFQSCFSLASITIPNSVTSIGDNAFNTCSSLTSIMIPDSVTSIGASAFNTCYSLASIMIQDGVTSISASAFSACYGLGEIHFLPTAPPVVANSNAFTNIQTDCKIYVPTGSLTAYTSATNYPSSSTYTYIEEGEP